MMRDKEVQAVADQLIAMRQVLGHLRGLGPNEAMNVLASVVALCIAGEWTTADGFARLVNLWCATRPAEAKAFWDAMMGPL